MYKMLDILMMYYILLLSRQKNKIKEKQNEKNKNVY